MRLTAPLRPLQFPMAGCSAVTRIAIVDSQPAVRAGLTMLLRTEPGLVPVGTANGAHDGLRARRAHTARRRAARAAPARWRRPVAVPPPEDAAPRAARDLLRRRSGRRARAARARRVADGLVDKEADARGAVRGDPSGRARRLRAARRSSPSSWTSAAHPIDPEDLALLAMLADGTPAADAADTLRLDPRKVGRRIERLLGRVRATAADAPSPPKARSRALADPPGSGLHPHPAHRCSDAARARCSCGGLAIDRRGGRTCSSRSRSGRATCSMTASRLVMAAPAPCVLLRAWLVPGAARPWSALAVGDAAVRVGTIVHEAVFARAPSRTPGRRRRFWVALLLGRLRRARAADPVRGCARCTRSAGSTARSAPAPAARSAPAAAVRAGASSRRAARSATVAINLAYPLADVLLLGFSSCSAGDRRLAARALAACCSCAALVVLLVGRHASSCSQVSPAPTPQDTLLDTGWPPS